MRLIQAQIECGLLDAARKASREGRRLIALKLTTAAASTNEADNGDVARALRVWLLSAIGEYVMRNYLMTQRYPGYVVRTLRRKATELAA